MIIDKLLQFSADQALTEDAKSTNSVDFGANRPVGPGEPLWLCLVCKVAPGGTSPTLDVSVETDDNSSFSSATAIASSAQLNGTNFPAGTVYSMPWPSALQEQYCRLDYDLGGTTPTVTVDAFLTNQDPSQWRSFPDAI
jgi:hypothetical protein